MEEMWGYTQAEGYEKPRDYVKEARKQFSRIGLMFVLGTIVIYAVQIIPIVVLRFVKPEWLWDDNIGTLVSILPMYLIGMPVLILLVKRIPADNVERHSIKPGSFILAVIMCFALMYIANIVGTVITTIIGIIKGSAVDNEIANVAGAIDLWLILFYMVLCAPIMEEYIFRKLIVERTVHYGQGVAVVLSGLMFGLFHGNLNQFVYATVLGMFLAYLYVRTGNLKITISIHMMINFMGGFVSSWIMREMDFNEYLRAANKGVDATMDYFMSHPGPVIGLMALGLFVIVVTLTGAILFIIFLVTKKFTFGASAVTLPKGKKFSTMFFNLGMMIYSIIWIAMIIFQLLQ